MQNLKHAYAHYLLFAAAILSMPGTLLISPSVCIAGNKPVQDCSEIKLQILNMNLQLSADNDQLIRDERELDQMNDQLQQLYIHTSPDKSDEVRSYNAALDAYQARETAHKKSIDRFNTLVRKQNDAQTHFNDHCAGSPSQQASATQTTTAITQKYYIQLSALKLFDSAVRQLETFSKTGLSLHIVKKASGTYAVWSGPFTSQKEASKAQREIRERHHLDSFVIRNTANTEFLRSVIPNSR